MDQNASPHAIDISTNAKRVRVLFNGQVVAETTHALTLREGNLPPVQYVPRSDANMSLMTRTAHTTHCPFKGDATYYSIDVDGRRAENAVWTYETPTETAGAIKDYLAFYPSRVDRIEESVE